MNMLGPKNFEKKNILNYIGPFDNCEISTLSNIAQSLHSWLKWNNKQVAKIWML